MDDANRAANDPRAVVFCPPLALFSSKERAREQDISEGLALSVELDKHPSHGREQLEQMLGPATVVVKSGGVWIDQDGQMHDKLHLHWRLAKPASDPDALAKLEARARRSDAHRRWRSVQHSGVPLHPLAWVLASQVGPAPVRDHSR